MSDLNPALCKHTGHIYGEWSHWKAVIPPMKVSFRFEDASDKRVPMLAYRWRFCLRCRAWERGDYQGGIVFGTRDQDPEQSL